MTRLAEAVRQVTGITGGVVDSTDLDVHAEHQVFTFLLLALDGWPPYACDCSWANAGSCASFQDGSHCNLQCCCKHRAKTQG